MSIGIDIVYIPEFRQRASNQATLERIFHQQEIHEFSSLESRAGLFAAKEAFMKALGKKCDWLSIVIKKQESGKPTINSQLIPQDQYIDVSVSHAGEYAIAIVSIEKI